MRHQKKRHRLGRAKGHRTRTLQALSGALIAHKRITTTEAKAKALRPFVEPLITRAKHDSQHNRRQVFRRLQDKHAVTELFNEVAVEVGDRPGGYTRVVKLGRRDGDGAELAMIELVDYNDVPPETGATGGRSRTRRGGGRRRRSKEASEEQKEQKETAPAPAEPAEPQAETEAAGEARAAGAPSAETPPEEQATAQAEETPRAEADAEPQNEADQDEADRNEADEEKK